MCEWEVAEEERRIIFTEVATPEDLMALGVGRITRT